MAAPYDTKSKLKRHVDGLIGEKSHADVLNTLRQSRFVLEQDKALKLTLPTLSLYCDWTQHVKLDRNEHGWAVLERLDALITGNSQQNISAVALQALRLSRLQIELGDLFRQVGASLHLVTEQGNWAGFQFVLLKDLCNRPIEWPDPKNRKAPAAYNKMMAARSPGVSADVYPHSLVLEHKDNGHEGPGFYYNIVCKQDGPHDLTVIGLLAR